MPPSRVEPNSALQCRIAFHLALSHVGEDDPDSEISVAVSDIVFQLCKNHPFIRSSLRNDRNSDNGFILSAMFKSFWEHIATCVNCKACAFLHVLFGDTSRVSFPHAHESVCTKTRHKYAQKKPAVLSQLNSISTACITTTESGSLFLCITQIEVVHPVQGKTVTSKSESAIEKGLRSLIFRQGKTLTQYRQNSPPT